MFILRRLFWAQRRRPTSRYSYIQAGGFPTTVEIRQTLAYGDGSAPFSTGRATNWTTHFLLTGVSGYTITGWLYGFIFRPQTYFNEDTAIMFRESVHHAVLEAIDQVTTAQGIRALSEEERKLPTLRSAPRSTPDLHLHLT
jgi:hypothetical protein